MSLNHANIHFSNVLTSNKYTCWDDIEPIIEQLETTKEKGDVLEQIAYAYFVYYKDLYQIEELYMGPDIPSEYREKFKLERIDNGVDGLIIDRFGKSIAYQVKFRSDNKLTYDDLTSFWSESENVDQRCVFSNCHNLPHQALKKKNQFAIMRSQLAALDAEFYDWLFKFCTTGNQSHDIIKYSPRKYQEPLISGVIEGFKEHDRGKLLAACGTGKTLTALWIKEGLGCTSTLFVAPNLALIKQTLEAWAPQSKEPFDYICVCSDKTVSDGDLLSDDRIDVSYIGVPVTTDSDDISEFLTHSSDRNKVIFSTYQSLDAVYAAVQKADGFCFDIAFFDEAHRTAGSKDTNMFTIGMSNDFIPCKRRLFMTATERIVSSRVINAANEYGVSVYSMDNEELYGPTFASLPFREAIEKGIISDYKIILSCMDESDLSTIVNENRLVTLDEGENVSQAKTVFKQIILAKAMSECNARKVISYHYNIGSAKDFIAPSIQKAFSAEIVDYSDKKTCISHINGSMSARERQDIFSDFIKADYGVISNARCLTEGIDVPIIDAVFFSDPRNSVVDIIQAIGRSLRKSPDKHNDFSYIIIPVIIPRASKSFSDIDPKEFETLHSVIQALKDQDHILADCIDKLNMRVATAGTNPPIVGGDDGPIVIDLPERMNIKDFANSLSLKIAEISAQADNITDIITDPSRASGIKRMFRTMGDMTIDTYFHNNVEPTIDMFDADNSPLNSSTLTINHNNLSHTRKVGAIIKRFDSDYELSEIGKALVNDPDSYVSIFREQMLKYYELDEESKMPFFPYRIAVRTLLKVGYLSKFEFAYSLYIMNNFSEDDEKEIVERIKYLRETYPNINILNNNNKQKVLNILNERFNTSLTLKDVWTTSTTLGNQFGYIRNHLGVLSQAIQSDTNSICISNGKYDELSDLLERTKYIEEAPIESLDSLYHEYRGI